MNKTARQTSVAMQLAMLRAKTASRIKKDAVSRIDMLCDVAQRRSAILGMVDYMLIAQSLLANDSRPLI